MEMTEDLLKRKDLIVRNLQEVLGEEKLTKQLSSGKNIHVYWGTATTGRPHIGYFVPMQKIADLLHAGIKVTILFADLHAFLDNLKSTFAVLEKRVLYYEHVIKALLTSLNVPIEKLHFEKGSAYQLSEEYTQYVLKLCACVSQRDALRAGAEVVKQVESPLLSGLLYPLLQALDEQFLKVDGQIGGVDQRKIFILAEEQLPKLKLGKRFHLMNPMVPGLTGSKMSSSEENTKIDLLDKAEVVSRKIDSAFCPRKLDSAAVITGNDESGGVVVENGILSFIKFVVLPILKNEGEGNLGGGKSSISIFGRDYSTFEAIETDFEAGVLNEQELKDFLKAFLNGILEKVRDKCNNDELRRIIEAAYPSSNPSSTSPLNGNLDGSRTDEVPIVDEEISSRYTKILNGNECIYPAQLQRALSERRPLRVVYRCAAKGRVNLAHFSALLQLKRIQRAGICECTILISDLGAYLDNAKCPWTALEGRSKYYEVMFKEFMKIIGLENVEICHTKEFEYKKDYVLDMYKSVSKVTRDESALVPGNTLATHLCPIYFALDTLHFDGTIDVLLVGENQRKFVELSNKIITSLDDGRRSARQPSALIIPQIAGMDGQRMSSTQSDFLLDPLETPKQTRQKIAKSFCEPGNLNGNVALGLVETIIFPVLEAMTTDSSEKEFSKFTIERSADNGGNLVVASAAELSEHFVVQNLHPADLKTAVVNKLVELFEPVRKSLTSDAPKLLVVAFPPAPKGAAKQKKV